MAQLVSSGLQDLFPMIRSEGRHVSHAIRRLCIQLGHFDDRPLPEDRTRLELGSAFEDALIDALTSALINRVVASDPDRYVRLGEQSLDGIYGTPDLYDLHEQAVIEVKLTWLSLKWDPESPKFWKYWKQLQAYCHMLGTRRAKLWICHINGDYKYGNGDPCKWCHKEVDGPHLHVWEPTDGEFAESELSDTWAMVKAYA